MEGARTADQAHARIVFNESEQQFAQRFENVQASQAAVHEAHLGNTGFLPTSPPPGFCPLWHSFHVEGNKVSGQYHILSVDSRWAITIHDFTLHRDTLLDFTLPEYLSVAWYKSISGEELTPYRKLRANSIWGFCSNEEGWRGLIHGGIPVQAIAIEVRPEFSQAYLEQEYGGQFSRVRDAYASLNNGGSFPEMRALLAGLWPKPGEETRTRLFYEGKVFEALGLIVERTKSQANAKNSAKRKPVHITPDDRRRIEVIANYINDHCTSTLSLNELAQAACMGPTKFKQCFKAVTGSTLTRYVQSRRISLAEALLRQTDLSIEQVARAAGYTCASHFSELFHRETGMPPSAYRANFK